MNKPGNLIDRRRFLNRSGLLTAGVTSFSILPTVRGAASPNSKVVVGVMGTSRNSVGGDGQGTSLAVELSSLSGVEVRYVCDVDERNVPKAIESIMTKGKPARPPKGVRDFRRILEDREVDALIIAAPDHWHAPAAILACSAGKHVYVEKPCSYNAHEGGLLVDAARKHKRLVQHGTQRRSWSAIQEAIERLRAGEIGRIHFAKSWYFSPRPSIGQGKSTAVPRWLDYQLWQGPAPERPFQDNVVHYNWHWFWHWGTGELGNNGVHTIDVCRWGLGVDYPTRITSAGGKYRYPDDDQETPDTNVVTFDFPTASISWEQRSWSARSPIDSQVDIVFHGEQGSLAIRGGGYQVYDLKGKELAQGSSSGWTRPHLQNFVDAIRGEADLNAEIEEGFKSTLLCHLGNIAYRVAETIRFDSTARKLIGGPEAEALWRREYRPGWEPRV